MTVLTFVHELDSRAGFSDYFLLLGALWAVTGTWADLRKFTTHLRSFFVNGAKAILTSQKDAVFAVALLQNEYPGLCVEGLN
jgi:hypothetical protein